jgi:biopolymer transport protein ExbB/TolQ
MDFITFLKTNFLHVAPILILAVAAIAIAIERMHILFMVYPLKNSEEFFEQIAKLVMSAKIQDAVSRCEQHQDKPIPRIIKAALSRAHLPENSIQDGVQLAVHQYTQRITKRTSFLATIANVATLLGLFGTIAGLVQSFEAVGHAEAQQKSALLSAGIATAMNATMLGLGVAIPCMIVFSFLMNRSNRLIGDLEETAVQILDVLKQRFYASEYIEKSAEAPSSRKST